MDAIRNSALIDSKAVLDILVLNSGSSSLKFGLYQVGRSQLDLLISGVTESIGGKDGKFSAQDASGKTVISETCAIEDQRDTVIRIAKLLNEQHMPKPRAIGHRVVHGGPTLRQHCLIDDAVLAALDAATVFAPLHAPPALSVIRYAREHFQDLAQVACFDTSFHADLPDVARTLPIALDLRAEGIQRYGFHGLSCESILHQLGRDLPEHLVIAHLGNGASITAIKDGRSIDTSMGLTPTGGIMMGTRCGDLDPGVLIYLMREKRYDAAMLEDLVDHRSGLKGISGAGSDLRDLHKVAARDSEARLALEMFCSSAAKQIAAMATALGGLDTVVFTGGIGEHDAATRAAICEKLSWIGIRLDDGRNHSADTLISHSSSRIPICVFPSQEDEQIARHVCVITRGILEY